MQVLLSLVSLAAATPVIVNQEEPFTTMQLYAHFAIDRSDQDISDTSGYGGGYGGGDYGGHGGSGYDASSGGHLESSGGFDGGHQDFSSGGGDFGGHGGDDGGHGISLDAGQNYVHSVPVSEHVEVTKPVAIPVYKHIGNVYIRSFISFFPDLQLKFAVKKNCNFNNKRSKSFSSYSFFALFEGTFYRTKRFSSRCTGSKISTDRRATSGSSWCSSTLSRPRSCSKTLSYPGGEDDSDPGGEEGSLSRGKTHSRTRRKASSYHDRETHSRPRCETVSHQNSRLQDHLSSCEETLEHI